MRKWVFALGLCWVAGCTLLVGNRDPGDGGDDASIADATPQFSDVSVIPPLASAQRDEQDPSISADGLELYFTVGAGGAEREIWVSTRASTTNEWGPPSPVAELNGGYNLSPHLSADDRTIWFTSDRPGGAGPRDIWVATRSGRGEPWSTPVSVIEVNTAMDEVGPAVGGNRMIFGRDLGAGLELFESVRSDESSPWQEPVYLDGINVPGEERASYLSADGLTLFFSSDRNGGFWNLYTASRPDTGARFDVAEPLIELNIPGFNDEHPTVTEDQSYIVFYSDRLGNDDLFQASR